MGVLVSLQMMLQKVHAVARATVLMNVNKKKQQEERARKKEEMRFAEYSNEVRAGFRSRREGGRRAPGRPPGASKALLLLSLAISLAAQGVTHRAAVRFCLPTLWVRNRDLLAMSHAL